MAWSWRMQATGATPDFATRLRRWASPMQWAPVLAPPFGRLGRRRRRPRNGRARDGRQHGSAATGSTSRSLSRHLVHCGLWIPDLREGDDSPLGTGHALAAQKTCCFQRLQTPRRRQSGPNAMWRTPLPVCIGASPWRSRDNYHAVRAAQARTGDLQQEFLVCDAVRLVGRLLKNPTSVIARRA